MKLHARLLVSLTLLFPLTACSGEDGEGLVGPAGPAGEQGVAGPIGQQGPTGTAADAIQNQQATIQSASFNINGSAAIGGGIYFVGGNGDLNGDNVLGGADRVVLNNHLLGATVFTIEQFQRADMDGDGRVTAMDRDIMTQVILGTPLADAQREGRRLLDLIHSNFVAGGNGDVNGSGGAATSGDAQRIIGYLGGAVDLTPLERVRADVNGDGRVDRLDADLIIQGGAISLSAAKRASDSSHYATTDGYFVIGKQLAGAPLAADCSSGHIGAMAIDTVNFRTYTCFSTGWRFAQTQQ